MNARTVNRLTPAIVLALASCAGDPPPEPAPPSPTWSERATAIAALDARLDHDLVCVAVDGDSAAFATCVDSMSVESLTHTFDVFVDIGFRRGRQQVENGWARVSAPAHRVAEQLAARHDIRAPQARAAWADSLSEEDRARMNALRDAELRHLALDATVRVDSLAALADAQFELGDDVGGHQTLIRLARSWIAAGRRERARATWSRGVDEALQRGDPARAVDHLWGRALADVDELDVADALADSALYIAHRHGLGNAGGRVWREAGTRAFHAGRTSLADWCYWHGADLAEDAGAMREVARGALASWMARDAVGEPPPSVDALSLARTTLASVAHRFDEEELDYHLATLDYLDAASALHGGDGARADSLMGAARRLATHLFQWDRTLSDISARHARRLLRDGDTARAATWFRRAATAADERGLPPRDRAAYHLEYAGAAYDDGRETVADSIVTAIEKMHRRQLDDRLKAFISTHRAARARDTGNPRNARRIAGAAVTQWHAYLSSRTPHAAAYASLESGERLRRLCRDLFATSPADRYAIDMTWRSTRQVLGRDFRSDERIPDGKTFLSWLREPASAPWWSEIREALDAGTVGAHVVYVETPGAVLRWTHRPSGVSEDTLRIAPGDTNWVNVLLPDDAFRLGGGQHRRAILISAEGAVATTPFARALDENGTYLIEHADVVWAPVLEGSKSDPPRRGTRLSVSNPRLPLELALGYSPIDGTTIAHALSERSASARHLTGAEATKSMVMGTWARSPVVILSGSSRGPAPTNAAPWLLATARVSPLSVDRAVLDVVDVRGADFSGCQFVGVIGVPSRAGVHLDQAFLDAGARAVLVARNVNDSFDPAAFLGDVAIASDRPGLSVTHAVCEIQRAWRRRLDPDRDDPTQWDGIAVQVSDTSPFRATISPFR